MKAGKPEGKWGAAIGAAFLMAMSSVGPGFLTQTAKFTGDYGADLSAAILIAAAVSLVAQLNIWRVLCVSGLRGQDAANRLLPGLGYALSGLVVLGGLVFNIGNVGGGALGLNTLFGLDTRVGGAVMGVCAILIFLLKNVRKVIDKLTLVLASVITVTMIAVIVIVKPDAGLALKCAVMPERGIAALAPAALTLIGGTVGGYIPFAGAHRMIDAGVVGTENTGKISKSAALGILMSNLLRILLFLAVLGVVLKFPEIDIGASDNPITEAFSAGAGTFGRILAGLVMLFASVSPIIGAAYTSVSFLKTFHPMIEKHENTVIIGFIGVSTAVMAMIGASPAALLVISGALNGLILPAALAVCLVCSQNRKIMGEGYRHPKVLFILGIIAAVITAYLGFKTFAENIAGLF